MQKTQASLRIVLYVEDNPANMALVEQLIGRRADLKLLKATFPIMAKYVTRPKEGMRNAVIDVVDGRLSLMPVILDQASGIQGQQTTSSRFKCVGRSSGRAWAVVALSGL